MHCYFEETLTHKDAKQHIGHYFDLPAGASRLNIHFTFAPARVGDIRNMLTLTLFDPAGFRGAGHRGGAKHQVSLSSTDATPGYRPGPLPPGLWMIEIDTHMILPDEPCQYKLEITAETNREPVRTIRAREDAVENAVRFTDRGTGWYRGDLHTHTVHSDGHKTVPELVEISRQHGLDFIVVTDHNTVAGLAEIDQSSRSDLLVLGGMELTTFWGHALCLTTRDWIDWRVGPERSMAEIARTTLADDRLFIIAHPCKEGDPICTGCNWRYADMMPGPGRHIEVWNHNTLEARNEAALALWYSWLNQGYQMVATAGTDAHDLTEYSAHPLLNVIYVDSLTEQTIIEALRCGHLYLSAGPVLEFTGLTAQGQVMVGDILTGPTATLTLEWDNCPVNARLRVIVDGQLWAEWDASQNGCRSWKLSAGQARWCAVEVRSVSDKLIALTNPIFLDSGLIQKNGEV